MKSNASRANSPACLAEALRPLNRSIAFQIAEMLRFEVTIAKIPELSCLTVNVIKGSSD